MKDNGFPKYRRISGQRRISGLFAGRESGFVFPFRYVFLITETDAAGTAVLISVSKRYHRRANKRNLLKRRTRESFRTTRHELDAKAAASGKKVDIALIYSTKEILQYHNIEDAVRKILAAIAERL